MPLLRILQHAEMRVSRSLVFAQTELSPCIIALDVLTNNVVYSRLPTKLDLSKLSRNAF